MADDVYTLKMKKGVLARKRNGKNQYTQKIAGKGDYPKVATLSDQNNVLAVAIAHVSLSRRAFGTGARPDDADRSFRITLLNPKSGSVIKDFDLGAFSPKKISLSRDGQLVFTVGNDLERREIKEVRAYNARSGREVHSSVVEKVSEVNLYSNGYTHAGRAWVIEQVSAGAVAIYNSRDPFSVAEYEVDCSSILSADSMSEQHSIGILPAVDQDEQENWVTTSGMLAKFEENGFNAVERRGMKNLLEELQLSMSGLLSASDNLANIGGLLSATHFLFSDVRQEGENILSVSRLVVITTGEIESSCNLICRDCQPQDLFEGMSAVAKHWIKSG